MKYNGKRPIKGLQWSILLHWILYSVSEHLSIDRMTGQLKILPAKKLLVHVKLKILLRL